MNYYNFKIHKQFCLTLLEELCYSLKLYHLSFNNNSSIFLFLEEIIDLLENTPEIFLHIPANFTVKPKINLRYKQTPLFSLFKKIEDNLVNINFPPLYLNTLFINFNNCEFKNNSNNSIDTVFPKIYKTLLSHQEILNSPIKQRNKKRVKKSLRFIRLEFFYKRKTFCPCLYCGKLLSKDEATLEHLTKIADGGMNSKGNIAIACANCNNHRNDKSVSEWKKKKSRGKIVPDLILFID